MATHDQMSAANMIASFGGPCLLRRSGMDRDCIAGELEFNPRAAGLALEGARRFLVAAPLIVPPDHELDLLIAFGEVLRIVLPVKGPRPDGNPIYYDLTVVYQSVEYE